MSWMKTRRGDELRRESLTLAEIAEKKIEADFDCRTRILVNVLYVGYNVSEASLSILKDVPQRERRSDRGRSATTRLKISVGRVSRLGAVSELLRVGRRLALYLS